MFCSLNWNRREIASRAVSYFHVECSGFLLRLCSFFGLDVEDILLRDAGEQSFSALLFKSHLVGLLTIVL